MKMDLPGVVNVKGLGKLFSRADGSRFYALKDVSFELKPGQVLGVIGRNGAGKSSLLSILSGIYRPDVGTASIAGKIGSVLDVGAGFHMDLSGFENIYLKGRIQGFTKAELRDKTSLIQDFSELGGYLEDPVKSYSSGMFLRLAFSYFLMLEYDVLLIDEVLSVGDLAFREKCFDYFLSRNLNSTMIIVSHDLQDVDVLADQILYLKSGEQKCLGLPNEVIMQYYKDVSLKANSDEGEVEFTGKGGSLQNFDRATEVIISSISVNGSSNRIVQCDINREIIVELEFQNNRIGKVVDIAFSLCDMYDNPLLNLSSMRVNKHFQKQGKAFCSISFEIPSGLFNQGLFYLNIIALEDRKNELEMISKAVYLEFRTDESFEHTDSKLVNNRGLLAPKLNWNLSERAL